MKTVPGGYEEFEAILRRRHASIMEARPDKNPGVFKSKINQAGSTVFVAPELVNGTLQKSFEFYRALEEPFPKAAYMMVQVSEVHPFSTGTGRAARIMKNDELVAGGEERYIIQTA